MFHLPTAPPPLNPLHALRLPPPKTADPQHSVESSEATASLAKSMISERTEWRSLGRGCTGVRSEALERPVRRGLKNQAGGRRGVMAEEGKLRSTKRCNMKLVGGLEMSQQNKE